MFKDFWENLKRRGVIQVGIAYAIAAWALVEGASLVLPTFNAPDWILRAIILAAFVGFPISIILAWIFDITPKGIVRTDDAEDTQTTTTWRLLLATPFLILLMGGGWWLWTEKLSDPENTFTAPESTDKPVIGILPIRNLTRDPEQNWVGDGISNLVRDNLAQSRYLSVVSYFRTQKLITRTPDAQVLFEEAKKIGISHLLSGEMLETPSGITVTVRLTDLNRDVEVGGRRYEDLGKDDVIAVSTPMATAVRQELNVPRTESVDFFAADFATRNTGAYESYVAGLQYYVQFDYEAAQQSFDAALQLAPDFAMARYRLAQVQAETGRTEAALINIQQAKEQRRALSDREFRYVDAAEAYFSRDNGLANEKYQALLEAYPYETEARQLLAYVLIALGQSDAVIEQGKILAEQAPENEAPWSLLGDTYLRLGQFDLAEPALVKFSEIAPNNPNSFNLLGDMHFYQAQYDQAVTQYQRALDASPDFKYAQLNIGYSEAMQSNLDRAIDVFRELYEDQQAQPRFRNDAGFELAYLLRGQGRFEEAEQTLAAIEEALLEEQVRAALGFSIRGLSKSELNEAEGAARLLRLAIENSPASPTRYLVARGLFEARQKDSDALRLTVQEIQSLTEPDATPAPVDAKSAKFLEGLALGVEGSLDASIETLQQALGMEGYEYSLYALYLTDTLKLAGQQQQALDLAQETLDNRNLFDPRLDLELDRQRLTLLLAELRYDAGQLQQGRGLAEEFLRNWKFNGPSTEKERAQAVLGSQGN